MSAQPARTGLDVRVSSTSVISRWQPKSYRTWGSRWQLSQYFDLLEKKEQCHIFVVEVFIALGVDNVSNEIHVKLPIRQAFVNSFTHKKWSLPFREVLEDVQPITWHYRNLDLVVVVVVVIVLLLMLLFLFLLLLLLACHESQIFCWWRYHGYL